RQIAGVLRDSDAGLHLVAIDVDHLPVGTAVERAIAGVAGATVRKLHREVAFTTDGEVEILVGLLHRALGHDARSGRRLDARAHLDTDGRRGALVGRLRTGAQVLL